jgi:phytol kinase
MALVLPALRWLMARAGAAPELARKSAHVALGCLCMALPWWFERPLPVWLLAACATAGLAAVRLLPTLRQSVGTVLHGVKRVSFGEICFGPAVATVFQLAQGDALAHVIPIGILTIADAAAALAGTRWGRKSYGSGGGTKTHLGSLVFLLAAWCCAALPLALCGRVDWPAAAMIGGVLGLLAMMAEGMADRGFDNLVVPLLAAFVLERILPLGQAELGARLVAAAALVAVTTAASRWSTLDGGALLGAALFGYGCAVVADWRFVLPPLAVFGCHLVVTRRHRLQPRFSHHLDAVLAHGVSCLPWVLMADRGWLDADACLAGVSFAMGTQLALLDAVTRLRVPGMSGATWLSVVKGWVFGATPGLVWLGASWRLWAGPALGTAVIGAIMVALVRKGDRSFARERTAERYVMGLLALAASAMGVLAMTSK